MWIINQDRDAAYKRTDEDLYSVPVLHNGKLFGFNLFMDDYFLGTFDSLAEIQTEIADVVACGAPYCVISGHSSYDSAEDFESLCAYVDGLTWEEYGREMD